MRKLDSLTTLRFFAAAMIVVHHSTDHFGIPHVVAGKFPLAQAVSFFFVLSGFILTYVYPTLDTWQARGRFWLARIARIWPAHVAAFALLWLLLGNPLRFPTGNSSWWLAAVNLSMVHAWVPIWNVFFSYNAVSWSISTEVAFYVLFPLLIWRWERTWWFKLPLAFGLSVAAIAFCQYTNMPEMASNPWAVSRVGILYINPISRLFEFTIGMTTALLFRRVSEKIQLPFLLATVAELAAIGLVVANMYYTSEAVAVLRNVPYAGDLFSGWAAQGPICGLSFAALIFVCGLQRGAISHLLSHKLGILLGEISFTTYLLHQILIYFYSWYQRDFFPYPNWLVYSFFWAILLLLAWLVWAGFERPLRGRILALWPNRDPKALARQLARAYDTPSKTTGWSLLLAPNNKAMLTGALGLAVLLIPAGIAMKFPPKRKVSPRDIAAIVAATPPEVRDARFGTTLELLGVQFITSPSRGPELKLVCVATSTITGDISFGIHFVDAKGNILSQADFVEDPAHFNQPDPWIDVIPLAAEKCASAAAVALSLYQRGSPVEPIDRGPRDWDNHRLIIPLAHRDK